MTRRVGGPPPQACYGRSHVHHGRPREFRFQGKHYSRRKSGVNRYPGRLPLANFPHHFADQHFDARIRWRVTAVPDRRKHVIHVRLGCIRALKVVGG